MSRIEIKCPSCNHFDVYYTLGEKQMMLRETYGQDRLAELIGAVNLLTERMGLMKIAVENCQYDIHHLRFQQKSKEVKDEPRGKPGKIDF